MAFRNYSGTINAFVVKELMNLFLDVEEADCSNKTYQVIKLT
jgi:hypothetical protein